MAYVGYMLGANTIQVGEQAVKCVKNIAVGGIQGAYDGLRDAYNKQCASTPSYASKSNSPPSPTTSVEFKDDTESLVEHQQIPESALRIAVKLYQLRAREAEEAKVKRSHESESDKTTSLAGIAAVYTDVYDISTGIKPGEIIQRHEEIVRTDLENLKKEKDCNTMPAFLPLVGSSNSSPAGSTGERGI